MAYKYFSDIENKGLKLKDYSNDPNFTPSKGCVLKYIPLKETKLFSIKWEGFESTLNDGSGNALTYLGHVIGHEGKNSLLSKLIKIGLATNLMAGPSNRLQNTKCGFYIDITLTELGQTENGLFEVLRITFALLNKLRRTGPKQFYIDEISKKKAREFYY